MTRDVHTFEPDDSGISCVHCGLPEPNVRHRTPAKVVQSLQVEIDHQTALFNKVAETLGELRKDQLYWSIVGQAHEDGLIEVVPVYLYLVVNVSMFQGDDQGSDAVGVSIDQVINQDGTVLYANGDYDDGGLAWDIFIGDMHLQPNDYVPYCFKIKPDVQRSTNRAYLSMDYVRIDQADLFIKTPTAVGSSGDSSSSS